MKLKGRTALVTGGAVRIGRAICLELAARGCNVVIHCNRSLKEARGLAADLEKTGVKAFTVRGDLSDGRNCARIISEARRKTGRLDVLINNAAVFRKDTVGTVSAPSLQEQSAINLLAPILLTGEFARRTRKGSVVNLLDRRIAGIDLSCVTYQLTKKALADFTLSAARELAPRIRVNGVAPGPVLASDRASIPREKAGKVPLGGRPTPADVARAVVFLLENDSITGQIVFVDGGQHLVS